MAHLPDPTHPLLTRLQARLEERLHDHKGPFTSLLRLGPTATLPILSAEESFNALLLAGTLTAASNPAATLATLLPHVAPDGALHGWVLGEGSFPELVAACHAVGFAPPPVFPAVQDVGALLQRHKLALPVADKDSLTLTFPSFRRMLDHLRQLGLLMRPPGSGLVTPRRLADLESAYVQRFARPDGSVPLTIVIIFFHAVQPSTATPKAAPRGSGKVSLVRILSPDDKSNPCQTNKPK